MRALAMAACLLAALAGSSQAETFIIEMRNSDTKDPNSINVFTPPVLRIDPGDSVKFVAVDPGHNTASKRGMIPEGAEGWNGKIDEEVEITFEVEGTYGYLCLPHYEMGMVGLVLVGDYSVNLAAAKKARHPGKARRIFRELFKSLEDRP